MMDEKMIQLAINTIRTLSIDAVQQALKRPCEQDHAQDCRDNGHAIGQTSRTNGKGRQYAADHGEAAVGEIDEAHQAHGHGQSDRHDEQHHAGGQATEQHVGDFDNEVHAPARRTES